MYYVHNKYVQYQCKAFSWCYLANLSHFMPFYVIFTPVQRSICNSNAPFVAPMTMYLSEAITSSDLNQISRKSLLEKGGKGKIKLNLIFFSIFTPVFILCMPTVTYLSETNVIFQKPMPCTNLSVEIRNHAFLNYLLITSYLMPQYCFCLLYTSDAADE